VTVVTAATAVRRRHSSRRLVAAAGSMLSSNEFMNNKDLVDCTSIVQLTFTFVGNRAASFPLNPLAWLIFTERFGAFSRSSSPFVIFEISDASSYSFY
jgi:hypothetical protein